MTYLTDSNFDTEVSQKVPHAIVLFAPDWSIHGNKIAVLLEALDPARVKVFRVDIDIATDVAMRFSIRESPTLIYFANGIAMERDTTLSDKILVLLK